MQNAMGEVHLVPAKGYDLGHAQVMTISQQDERGIAVTMPAGIPSSLHQPPDFLVFQLLEYIICKLSHYSDLFAKQHMLYCIPENPVLPYRMTEKISKQNLNSDKIRAALYNKIVVPLFAIALLLILFFKLPFHARMMNIGSVIALSLGATFVIWGILFGLNQMGSNGVLIPEFTAILPIVLLWLYAIYVYITDEKSIA